MERRTSLQKTTIIGEALIGGRGNLSLYTFLTATLLSQPERWTVDRLVGQLEEQCGRALQTYDELRSAKMAGMEPPAAASGLEITVVGWSAAFGRMLGVVDTTRIYATGFSMGGSAAWLAPTLDASLLAAILTFSGIAPSDEHAATFTALPALVVHGNADSKNPITGDPRFIQAIQRAGGTQVQLREYDGLGRQPPADLQPGRWWRDWLFAQRRP
ncbi:MAG: hypothetical protein GAK43_00005 [Stenotrophomonas maltophilia]|nr:MAG: hypothetical protein GAK43_00005 [Stenotrophomonas maltophilia]